MMFGLAITTTAAYLAVDAAYLSGRDAPSYRRYAVRFALGLHAVGILWFAGFGTWYIFGTRAGVWQDAMRSPVMSVLFPLTAAAPGLPWLLMAAQSRTQSRRLAALVGIAQFGVIALNAVSRQWLQNRELAPYADLAAVPVRLQASPLIVFLLLFAVGIGVLAWMVRKIVQVNRREFEAGPRDP
jgi:hypothetical protein